jgi:hypothetical protein
MTDNVQTTDNPNKVRRQAMYEVQLFAQEAGISIEQAKEIMDRFGHDRETLMREAGKLVKQMG